MPYLRQCLFQLTKPLSNGNKGTIISHLYRKSMMVKIPTVERNTGELAKHHVFVAKKLKVLLLNGRKKEKKTHYYSFSKDISNICRAYTDILNS